MPTTQVASFKLICVGCRDKETRPASECTEQPYCKKCFLPMVLDEVTIQHRETPRKVRR